MKRHLIYLTLFTLATSSFAFAKNENSNNSSNNGNSHYGQGNNGQGHGNTGPGNQGNDKPVGNAGGNNNGHYGEGNHGQGHGNTGPGNQGNDKPVGNAGGNQQNPGTDNPGTDNPGTDNPGTDNPGTDNPGTDNPGTDNQTSSQDSQKQKLKLNFTLLPLVFGDYDNYTKVYNLSTEKEDSTQSITIDDYSNGLKVVKKIDYSVGLGVAGALSTPSLPGIGISIGLAPFGGEKVTFVKLIDSEKDLKSAKYKIPYQYHKAIELSQGESVEFASQGGLTVGLGIGAYGFGAGTRVVIDGTFKTLVEKAEGDNVLVTIGETKARKAAFHTGFLLGNVSLELAKQITKDLTYKMDLSNPEAQEAYEEFLKGDMTLAEAASLASKSSGVSKITTYNQKRTGKLRKSFFGIPFIFTTSGKGFMHEISSIEYHQDDLITNSEYGLYVHDKNTRLVSRHKSISEVFQGGIAITKKVDDKTIVSSDLIGQFSWSYEDDHGSSKKLAKYLTKLKKKIGNSSLLNLGLPSEKKLGYTEIKYSTTYPRQFVNHLISISTIDGRFEQLQARSHELMFDYFKDQNDEFRICPWNVGKDRLSKAGVRICTKTFAKRIRNTIKKAKDLAQNMAIFKGTNQKHFVKEFAKFGKEIWENTFVFQAFARKGQKCGLTSEFLLTGRRLSQTLRQVQYEVKETCQSK